MISNHYLKQPMMQNGSIVKSAYKTVKDMMHEDSDTKKVGL